MPTIIHHLPNLRRTARAAALAKTERLSPNYDCREHAEALKLLVYVPGVTATGVEITARGPDLTVVARKPHFVRSNWSALHLEKVSRDYELTLRLGYGLDYAGINAEIADGILTITLPKRAADSPSLSLRRAA